MQIQIPYRPHPAQQEIHNCPARFRILSCGTKLGKTELAVNEALRFALSNPETITYWVAPVYHQCKVGWKKLQTYLPQKLVKSQNKQYMTTELVNGSVIMFKSADIPAHLRGEDVSFIVVDEAAFISEDAWHSLLTTITRSRGRGIFISTPHGRNFFFKMFKQGLEDKTGEYKSFTFPTAANPYIDPKEIEKAKMRLPRRQFEIDYLAMFHDDTGVVFAGADIDRAIRGVLCEPEKEREYFTGVDLGRHEDATVLSALDDRLHLCGFKYVVPGTARWPEIIEETVAFARKWNNALVAVDSTGAGDPIYERFEEEGLYVEPYSINSNPRKIALIRKLAISLEQGRLTFPRDGTEPLEKELRDFSYRLAEDSSTVRYEAPSGEHDDCVVSLALANWLATQERGIWFEDRAAIDSTL